MAEPIKWDRRRKIRTHPHGQLIDNTSTETKADSPDFAAAIRPGFQPRCGREKVVCHFRAVNLSEKLCGFLVISGIASYRCQPIGRKCDELGDRQPPRYILYVWIEAAVLVDDQDCSQFSRSIRRVHQIAADASVAARRRHGRNSALIRPSFS